MKIGIIAALDGELQKIIDHIDNPKVVTHVMREFHMGRYFDHEVVAVISRIGKVAAATTTTLLIEKFNVDAIVMIGVAGAIGKDLKRGDIVVGTSLVQHDMDASPIFPRHEIPLLSKVNFECNKAMIAGAKKAVKEFLKEDLEAFVSDEVLKELHLDKPVLHTGVIASGDLFMKTKKDVEKLRKRLPDVVCVEMEGAAVAQIAYEFQIPAVVIRIISDGADEDATHNFSTFMRKFASHLCYGVMDRFLENPLEKLYEPIQ